MPVPPPTRGQQLCASATLLRLAAIQTTSPSPTPHRSPIVEQDPARLADSLGQTLQAPESPKHRPTDAFTISAPVPPYSAAGHSPGRQAQGRMRSSIACIRCRRSKVKCVNNGVGTTCRACENANRECSYPSPVAGGGRRRDSVSGRLDAPLDGERRQRPRKSIHTFVANPASGPCESPRPLLDALDPRLLTPTVWQELFDIFQVHYSADLPFLHPPTFLKPLRQASMQPPPLTPMAADANASARPPASPEFLLAFLALTARFHPKLVAHHSPPTSTRPTNPLVASEYYATAANERLVTNWTDNIIHDIERTQATLMLGLHEWGMCRGAKAWLTIGMAIRAAQAMGLQYEQDLDDEPMSRSQALDCEAERMGVDAGRKSSLQGALSVEDAFIQQEIRRRTFWSCYIMDRYLSSGKYRPQMLHARELRIQLPASERSFLFAEKVRTLMLGEEDHRVAGRAEVQSHRQASVLLGTSNSHDPAPRSRDPPATESDEDKGRLETGADEGLVSRYVKILEIYGKVVQWSCAGGRRAESHPPWDPRCEFYKLRSQCLDFKASLPRQHTLTPQNTQAHISLKTSTPYTLVHTIYLLCQIMLHREYVPFIPIRCKKPEGPLDPPIFSPDRYDVPPGFWEDSARECFKAARQIMDLVSSCQEWSALVETPIVGFAIYTAAFSGVYCMNFQHMDPDGYMCSAASSARSGSKAGGSKGFEAARKAAEMIVQMRPRLHMAEGWWKTISRMHKYYKRMQRDYDRNVKAMDSSESDSSLSTRHLSLREGGIGGGLDEYKQFERSLNDFGDLGDQDVEMRDYGQRPGSRSVGDVYDDSHSGTTVKSEEQEHRMTAGEHAKAEERGPWNAINAGPPGPSGPASRQPSISAQSGQFRSYDSFPSQEQTPQQPQQPPYTHQIQLNNFRPACSQDTPSAPGAPPSLTSPASHSASTPSQPSPPFDRRQSQPYGSWTPQNPSYSMQPPQLAYANGISHHSQLPTPIQSTSMYPTPGLQGHQQQQQQQPPPPPLQPESQLQEPVQPTWDLPQKEAWLNSLPLQMGADDFAAFTEGGDIQDWAMRNPGYGWLSMLWSPSTASRG